MSRENVKGKKQLNIIRYLIVSILIMFQVLGINLSYAEDVQGERKDSKYTKGTYLDELYRLNIRNNREMGFVTINELIQDADEQIVASKKNNTDFEWYNIVPSSVVGEFVISTESANFKLKDGYCLGHVQQAEVVMKNNEDYIEGKNVAKIVNVVDVDTQNRKIIVYSENNKEKGKEIKFTDEEAVPILMLGWLSWQADKNNELNTWLNDGPNPDSYKLAMQQVIVDKTYQTLLGNAGFSEYLKPIEGETNEHDGYTQYGNAKTWADGIKNNRSTQYTFESLNEKPGYKKVNNETYIGPYKLAVSGCEIGSIAVNGRNLNQVFTSDLNISKSVTDITVNNGKTEDFYIKIKDANINNLDDIKSIEVKTKDKINMGVKSRMMFTSAGGNQPFIIFKGNEQSGSPVISLKWPEVQEGKLNILKHDELGNIDDLSGIGFKVYNKTLGSWVKVENGEIKFDTFDNATEFKTEKDGKVPTIDNLPEGTYNVYETTIPEQLKDLYELPKTNVPIGKKQ